MKKSGFTLIELIIAITVLMIGISCTGYVFSMSVKNYDLSKIKIENTGYSDTVINILKANGKLTIGNIYNSNLKDINTNVSYYLFFNNLDELKNQIMKPTNLVNSTIPKADIGTFTSCKNLNTGSKKSGSFISISDHNDENPSLNFDKVDVYSVLIKVWNFNYGEGSEVKFKIYLGR